MEIQRIQVNHTCQKDLDHLGAALELLMMAPEKSSIENVAVWRIIYEIVWLEKRIILEETKMLELNQAIAIYKESQIGTTAITGLNNVWQDTNCKIILFKEKKKELQSLIKYTPITVDI